MDTNNTQTEYDSKVSFWKKNAKTVPGRPSPKKDQHLTSTLLRNSGSTSFNDFQASVNDAWDLEDDDFCTISSSTTDTKKYHGTQGGAQGGVLTATSDNINPSVHSSLKIDNKYVKSSVQQTQMTSTTREVTKKPTTSPTNTEPIYKSLQFKSPNKRWNASAPERNYYPGRPQALCCPVLPTREADCELKLEKFETLLNSVLLDLTELRQLSWSGIPIKVRAITWRLLSGYLPANLERRAAVLERKRLDYWNLVKQYYDTERDESYQDTYRQIHIDIPRMNPLIPLFQQITVQEMFERILFIWAIRHPASGYVQGINDLVTPFFVVFLQEVVSTENLQTFDINSLAREQRDIIEADSFWCLSKFLDSIQDNYIFAQLGIQQKVNQLKELIQRIDSQLHQHLQNHDVDYLQFSFRWINNLLTRELPLPCTIRLWDTYLAESDGFATFQLYVCAAFLLHWRTQLLQEQDFQGLLLMLQNLPTHNWTNSQIGMLVAEAYRLKFTFADAPNHLINSKSAVVR